MTKRSKSFMKYTISLLSPLDLLCILREKHCTDENVIVTLIHFCLTVTLMAVTLAITVNKIQNDFEAHNMATKYLWKIPELL